ncbi:MAG: PEGA domain-containing protein [Polyangiaceae bacterium]
MKPSNAIVTLDGNRISATEPFTHPIDASKHDLSFTAPGFRPLSESITFDHDQTLTVDLSPLGTSAHATSPIRSSSRPATHPPATVTSTPSAAPPANAGFTEVHPRDPRPIDTTVPF